MELLKCLQVARRDARGSGRNLKVIKLNRSPSYSFVLIALTLFSVGHGNSQEEFKWCDTCKLSWQEFNGEIPFGSMYGAVSFVNINFKYNVYSAFIKAEIYAYFNTQDSWVKSKTDTGLIHEQGHFNIAELYSRKLKKYLSSKKMRRLFIPIKMQRAYKKFYRLMADTQFQYDIETEYGLNSEKQKYWLNRLERELRLFEEFNDDKIKIAFNR